jgi:uncharacterized membrane protein YhaH (DUF805 family)
MIFCPGCGAEMLSTRQMCSRCGVSPRLIRTERHEYGFGESVGLCLSHYAQFSGRSPRAEYWYFGLFVTLVGIGASLADTFWLDGSLIAEIVTDLALLLPSMSVGVRRLHDGGRSGWWFGLLLLPVVGAVIVLVWLSSKGTPGSNRFGPDPLAG